MKTMRIIVDGTLKGRRELIDFYSRELSFPYPPGSLGWDAFRDVLVELDDWLEECEIVIEHSSMPGLFDEDMNIYVNILYETERTWKRYGTIDFSVNYPVEYSMHVDSILANEALGRLHGCIKGIYAGKDGQGTIKKYYVITTCLSCVHIFFDQGLVLRYDSFSVYELENIEKSGRLPILKAESGIVEIIPLEIHGIGDGRITNVARNTDSLELCFDGRRKIIFSISESNVMMQGS